MKTDWVFFNSLLQLMALIKDPNEIAIAGGAIRDSLLEKPIKDIDIFYRGSITTDLEEQGFIKIKEKSKEKYDESIFSVIEPKLLHNLVEFPIQLIQVKKPLIEHINQFPCNISRIALSERCLWMHPTFLQGVEFQVLKFDTGCSAEYKHRLKKKYHDWAYEE